MAGKGKSSRGRGGKSTAVGGRGNNPAGKSTGGIRINTSNPSSSHSSNPSSNTRPSVSRPSSSSLPSQYPPSTLPPSSQQVQSPPPPHSHPQSRPSQQVQSSPPPPPPPPPHDPVQIQHPPPPAVQIPDNHPPYQPPPPPPEQQDFDQLLNDLLALPGRENLPLLSQHPIPDVQTLWFNRDKGKLTRVISGIFRKKFDGPYFSWSITPIHIQERYFRTFARKYNWDLGITELVKDHLWTIAKRRMKGIVSQAKTSGQRPVWIHPTIWTEMSDHWNTPDAIEKSENASQSRNSDRGGLGPHKH
ncbi:hypothetical protein V5N11_006011 [Cardamine amara subsp. amara]|uniref:Uncharacterized protein n=1 Tax=Cardamine amara subsp. amara TaxID=228776 RepID=A0ABD1BT67_CARAN